VKEGLRTGRKNKGDKGSKSVVEERKKNEKDYK
jgi:hypothetical protein